MFTLLCCICATGLRLPVARAEQSDRVQAEREIRKAIYDLGAAQASGNVEVIKELTAKRTLVLYKFVIDVLQTKFAVRHTDPGKKSGEDASGTPNSSSNDEFFDFMMRTAAESAGEVLTPEEIERRLRAEAARPIAFVNDRKARIESPNEPDTLIVFEDGRWKIDDTDVLKEQLLRTDDAEIFSPEQREHIRKY